MRPAPVVVAQKGWQGAGALGGYFGARLQAAMAATYMIGYRLAMIVAGAGVLWLAAWVGEAVADQQ